MQANPLEFSGTLGVSFNTSANPLKMTLSVYFEFSHNGEQGWWRQSWLWWRYSSGVWAARRVEERNAPTTCHAGASG